MSKGPSDLDTFGCWSRGTTRRLGRGVWRWCSGGFLALCLGFVSFAEAQNNASLESEESFTDDLNTFPDNSDSPDTEASVGSGTEEPPDELNEQTTDPQGANAATNATATTNATNTTAPPPETTETGGGNGQGNNNLGNNNLGNNNLGNNNLGNNNLGNNNLGNNNLGNNDLGNTGLGNLNEGNDLNESAGNNGEVANDFGLAGNEAVFGDEGGSNTGTAEPMDTVSSEAGIQANSNVSGLSEAPLGTTNADELVTAGAIGTAGTPSDPAARIDGLDSNERELVRSRINELKPRPPGTYPEEYIVQPGDTLWDICDQLLDDPFWWPKLWAFNASILNPHLIEPGMRIVFAPSDGVLPPSFGIADTGEFLPAKLSATTFKPDQNPNVEAWQDLRGTMISPGEVGEFQLMDIYESAAASVGNMVLLPALLTSSPPETLGVIAEIGGQSIAPGKGGVVYSNRDTDWQPRAGERFVTMRPQAPMSLRALDESEPGSLWVFSGVIGVVSSEASGRTRFVVEDSLSGIRAGDIIVPFRRLLYPADESSGDGRPAQATVVAIGDGDRVLAGLYDVIHLVPDDEGGLNEGDVVDLVSPAGGLPAFEDDVDMMPAGRARVVAVSPQGAAAIITQVEREIVLGSRTVGSAR